MPQNIYRPQSFMRWCELLNGNSESRLARCLSRESKLHSFITIIPQIFQLSFTLRFLFIIFHTSWMQRCIPFTNVAPMSIYVCTICMQMCINIFGCSKCVHTSGPVVFVWIKLTCWTSNAAVVQRSSTHCFYSKYTKCIAITKKSKALTYDILTYCIHTIKSIVSVHTNVHFYYICSRHTFVTEIRHQNKSDIGKWDTYESIFSALINFFVCLTFFDFLTTINCSCVIFIYESGHVSENIRTE